MLMLHLNLIIKNYQKSIKYIIVYIKTNHSFFSSILFNIVSTVRAP